jgi:hypothetical protein
MKKKYKDPFAYELRSNTILDEQVVAYAFDHDWMQFDEDLDHKLRELIKGLRRKGLTRDQALIDIARMCDKMWRTTK